MEIFQTEFSELNVYVLYLNYIPRQFTLGVIVQINKTHDFERLSVLFKINGVLDTKQFIRILFQFLSSEVYGEKEVFQRILIVWCHK